MFYFRESSLTQLQKCQLMLLWNISVQAWFMYTSWYFYFILQGQQRISMTCMLVTECSEFQWFHWPTSSDTIYASCVKSHATSVGAFVRSKCRAMLPNEIAGSLNVSLLCDYQHYSYAILRDLLIHLCKCALYIVCTFFTTIFLSFT